MAEYAVVSRAMTIPLSPGIEDAVAAALGNPGLATVGLAPRQGEVPGRRSGADQWSHRDRREAGHPGREISGCIENHRYRPRQSRSAGGIGCSGCGRDHLSSQPREDLLRSFRSALHEPGVQVVIDFLWGPSAEAILAAAAGHGSLQGEPRIRFVQVGAISGNTITLPGGLLRSSGVELLGSGLGSLSSQAILQSLSTMFEAQTKMRFAIDIDPVPLSEVEEAWTRQEPSRIVFIP